MVELKGSFTITEYSESLRLLSILLDDDTTHYVPAQLPTLNIHFPCNDFVYPSDHLPITSKGYFKRVRMDPKLGAIYLYGQNEVTLQLYSDFRYSGRYMIKPVNGDGINIERVADRRTRNEFFDDMGGLIGQKFPGNIICGRVLRMFSPITEKYYHYAPEDLEEALEYNNEDELVVVFQDEGSTSEFYFTKNYLNIMSP